MQSAVDTAIKDRFFEAINLLVASKVLRGKKTFCDEMGINRGMFYFVETGKCTIRPSWLTHLVKEYKVSASWLLTGRGKMLRA